MFVRPDIEPALAQAAQQVRDGRLGGSGSADGHRIDEKPDARLRACNRRVSARPRRAEAYVLLAAVTCQQDGPSALHQRVQRHLGCSREIAQFRGERRIQSQLCVALRASRRAALQPFHGQRSRRTEAAQLLPPECLRARWVLRRLPHDKVPIRTRQRGHFGSAIVETEHLIQHDWEAPAIE